MAPTGARRSYRQACPVAHTLDLVGERWTLLLVRDLMFGALRFTDLRDGLPGLAPNLLSERLRFLVVRGLVEQVELPPPAARTVYALTPRGRQLAPVVHELARFGIADWDDPDLAPPPPRLLRGALLALASPERLDSTGWSAAIALRDATVTVTVAPQGDLPALRRLHLAEAAGASSVCDVEVGATLGTLLALRRGQLTHTAAAADGRLTVRGAPHAAEQVGRLFGWRE